MKIKEKLSAIVRNKGITHSILSAFVLFVMVAAFLRADFFAVFLCILTLLLFNIPLLAKRILETVGMREKAIEVVSCPTCGRTEIDLIGLANSAEERLEAVAQKRRDAGLRPLKIAVMGCAVNGPGESREADYGIAGGKGEGLVFSHGEIIEKVSEDRLVDRLIEIVEQDAE